MLEERIGECDRPLEIARGSSALAASRAGRRAGTRDRRGTPRISPRRRRGTRTAVRLARDSRAGNRARARLRRAAAGWRFGAPNARRPRSRAHSMLSGSCRRGRVARVSIAPASSFRRAAMTMLLDVVARKAGLLRRPLRSMRRSQDARRDLRSSAGGRGRSAPRTTANSSASKQSRVSRRAARRSSGLPRLLNPRRASSRSRRRGAVISLPIQPAHAFAASANAGSSSSTAARAYSGSSCALSYSIFSKCGISQRSSTQ